MKETLPTLRTLGPHRPRRRRVFPKLLFAIILAVGGTFGYQHFSPFQEGLPSPSALVTPSAPSTSAPNAIVPTKLEVFFSPQGGCTDAIVGAIANAKRSIHLQAYSFTSAPIAEAMVNAKKRGIDVRAVLDRSQDSKQYSSADFIHRAGIPTFIDDQHAIAHNKVIIIDEERVITGSFNFSKAAEFSNAENILIIDSKPLAAKYLANWKAHQKHSYPYPSAAASADSELPLPR